MALRGLPSPVPSWSCHGPLIMNQDKNRIAIWSIKPLEDMCEISVRAKEGLASYSVYSFMFDGSFSDKETEKEIKIGLKRFYHRKHNFKLTFKKMAKNFKKQQKLEWQDTCDGKVCHYIYLRDYLMAIVAVFIKIKDFLWRIRI